MNDLKDTIIFRELRTKVSWIGKQLRERDGKEGMKTGKLRTKRLEQKVNRKNATRETQEV